MSNPTPAPHAATAEPFRRDGYLRKRIERMTVRELVAQLRRIEEGRK